MDESVSTGPELFECRTCHKRLPQESYYSYKSRNFRRHTACKACWAVKSKLYDTANRERIKVRRREYHQANKDLVLQRVRAWVEANPDKRRDYRYRHEFGSSLAEYETKLKAQNGLCAICGKPPTKRRLALDHNHITKVRRDLLCARCNTLIGRTEESIEILKAAVSYLEKWNGVDNQEHEAVN